ncbi:MAG: ABC transporter permease subunit [Firmicutes bacterium]|nr:ABC transporter permease subunit [Bacillota bacterium]
MTLLEGILEAAKLVITLDPAMMQIIFLSLQVSTSAVIIASLLGIPYGAYLGLRTVAKVRWQTRITYTFMGFPPVVAGLVVYLLLSSSGPFGVLDLIFSPAAMISVQALLALPIITGLSMVGIRERDNEFRDTAISLGANPMQVAVTVVKEARYAIMGAVVAGFGRIIAEVGAVMMVGGNIEGHTRVMTTAIVLETRKGNFELAIGLGLVLMAIAFFINSLLYKIQNGGSSYEK